MRQPLIQTFPSDGRFLDVTDPAETNRGQERVAELGQQRPTPTRLDLPAEDATFDYAVAINWDKSLATHSVAATLRLMGYDPGALFRPSAQKQTDDSRRPAQHRRPGRPYAVTR